MLIEAAPEPTFGNLQRQMQRVMDQMQKNFFNFCPSETWTPNVNLYESERSYLVCVDLAGVEKEKIVVEVIDGKLMLRGTRAVPAPVAADPQTVKFRVHVMEIDHGTFSREVDLPEDVEHDGINATHQNGLLWIELPKK